MFSEIRTTEMAVYLLSKAGDRMAYIKLLKLLYLAERQAMARWGESISGDHFVSMPHGPVLSQTYDLIKGVTDNSPWSSWIKDEANYEVSLCREFDKNELEELSHSELKILDKTYESFGSLSRFEIVEYTHDNCAEWEDPNGSSFPIKPESIFRAMGKEKEEIQKLIAKNIEETQLDQLKSKLL